MKGGCRRPIEAFPRRGHVTTYISLERSHRVEQLCPLGQSDPRTTGGARGRQIRKLFLRIFLFLWCPYSKPTLRNRLVNVPNR